MLHGQAASGVPLVFRAALAAAGSPACLCLTPAAALCAALLLALFGLLAAVGIAVDGDDLGVVDEAVDQGDDAGGVGEGLAPLGEGDGWW